MQAIIRLPYFPQVDVSQFDLTAKIERMTQLLYKPIDGLNIITTQSNKKPELYGWQSPIAEHVDGTGYVFFMPIYSDAPETLCICNQVMPLEVGYLYLMDDTKPHYTTGKGNVVALFNGSYQAGDLAFYGLFNEVYSQFEAYLAS